MSPEHGKVLIFWVNRWIYNIRYTIYNSNDNIIRTVENTEGVVRLLFNFSSNQFEASGGILFLKNNSLDIPLLAASGTIDTILGSDKQWRKIRNNDIWDNTIQGIKMVDNSILGAKIWDASIWGAKLINGTITSTQMGINSVGTNAIIDANITTAKIANDAITTGKIFNNSITGPKILDGQVWYAKLSNPLVLNSELIINSGTIRRSALYFTDNFNTGGNYYMNIGFWSGYVQGIARNFWNTWNAQNHPKNYMLWEGRAGSVNYTSAIGHNDAGMVIISYFDWISTGWAT